MNDRHRLKQVLRIIAILILIAMVLAVVAPVIL